MSGESSDCSTNRLTPAVTVNLRAAGGAAMIWDSVMSLLYEILAKAEESSP